MKLLKNLLKNMKINTKPYEGIIKQVLIDDRENERIQYGMEQYAPFNPTKAHLEIGDYLFIGYNGIKVCVEYKEAGDFLTSIVNEDNHLHNQTYDMVTNYDYTFILAQVEDLRKELNKRYYQTGQDISFQQINGAVSTFNTVTTVVMTQTRYQAFDMMFRQAGKLIEQKPILYKFGRKDKNTALNYLSAMKGVGKRAENIVNTLDVKTLNDLLNLTKEDLVKVDLVGEKTAEMILKNIGGSHEQTEKL